jgi:hypothetical protein
MLFHPVPANGVPSLKKLDIFLLVTFSADLGFNCGFLEFGLVVIFMTGDTIDSLLGMLAVDPCQKDAPGIFLMAGETIPDLFFCPKTRDKGKNEKD